MVKHIFKKCRLPYSGTATISLFNAFLRTLLDTAVGGDTATIPAHLQARRTDGDDCNYKGQHEGGSYKILIR